VFRAFVSVSLTMLITLCAFAIVALIYRVPIGLGTLFVLPGLVLTMIASLLLIAIFAHMNARFRVVAHMASIGMNVLFYVTPVLYPADLLRRRGNLAWVVELNPAYHLIEVVRHPLVSGAPAAAHTYVAAVTIVALLGLGAAAVVAVFQRRIVFAL
jgi:ABC-type polysaccharide/polyol phosphate export permease